MEIFFNYTETKKIFCTNQCDIGCFQVIYFTVFFSKKLSGRITGITEIVYEIKLNHKIVKHDGEQGCFKKKVTSKKLNVL